MDLSKLNSIIDSMPDDPAPAPAPGNIFGRIGKSVANLPLNIVEGLGQSAVNLTQMGTPGVAPDKVNIPNFFDIAPPEGLGEKAVDVLAGKGGLADIVGQSLVPAGILGKLGKAAGMAEGPGMEALKWAGGFAGPELGREDATGADVGIAAALGGSQGALSFLPRKARLLPTLGVAALHGLYETGQHDATTGLIAFGADVVGGMLPSHMAHPDASVQQRSGLGLSEIATLQDRGLQDSPLVGDLRRQELEHPMIDDGLPGIRDYQAGATGSLKEGVRLINPEGLQGHVPTSDFLASFEATLPDRTSSYGIAERKAIFGQQEPKGPFEWEPPRMMDAGPTVGSTYPEFATLQNEGPIEGVLPRFQKPLITGPEPSNPSSIFPVEQSGSGPRSEEEIAAMQKALKFKKPKKVEDPEKVISAVVKYPNGEVFESTSHPSAFDLAITKDPSYYDQAESAWMGFKTNKDRLVSREEAFKLGKKSKQIDAEHLKLKPKELDSIGFEWGSTDTPTGAKSFIEHQMMQEESPPITLSPEEAQYQRSLFAKQTPEELQGNMQFYDEQIADTLDPEAKAHLYALKQLAQDSLERVQPQAAEIAAKAVVQESTFKTSDRVIYRDTFGQEQSGIYKGKTSEGQAKVLFEGDEKPTNVSHSNLKGVEAEYVIPEIKKGTVFTEDDESFLAKWLTEQKLDQLDEMDPSNAGQDFKWETRGDEYQTFRDRAKGSLMWLHEGLKDPNLFPPYLKKSIKEFKDIYDLIDQAGHPLLEADASHAQKLSARKWLENIDVTGKTPIPLPDFYGGRASQALKEGAESFIRNRNLFIRALEKNPDLTFQDFLKSLNPNLKFETRAGVASGEKFATLQSTLPAPAIKAVDKIVAGIKDVVNQNLDIKFSPGERFRSGTLANSGPRGEIEINRDQLIQALDGWHNFSAKDKAKTLAEVSRWMGHEVGHTILSFLSAKEPKLINKLIKEFEILGEAGRLAIVKDFHEALGLRDAWKAQYGAGHAWLMSDIYGFHPENIKAMQVAGVQEFFAEMSAAHIFGKLREEFLPPEMKSLWSKFKDLMKGVVGRLFSTSIEDVDTRIAHNNFKNILSDLHDRFSLLTKPEYEALSQQSEVAYNKQIRDLVNRDTKIRQRIALEDFQAAQERIIQEERDAARGFIGDFTEDKNYMPGDEFKFATMQSPPTQMQQPIVGNRAFIQSEIARHLGVGIAGGVLGGALGPRLSNQQMTVAEGVFAGAVLGFAGPIALRRMFMTMPQAGAATFQHMPAKEAFQKLFTLSDLKSLGGDAATGQGSAPAKFVRWLERNMNLHLPQELFNAVVKSEGPASEAVQLAGDAFEKARTFKTNPVIDTAVERYLRGSSTVTDLRRVLGPHQDAQNFANFIVTGRESIGLLQEMLASGLKDGSFKGKVLESLQKGDYLTRQYRMFHDVDYKPSQSQIESVALELAHANPDYDLSTSRQIVEDYLHQIELDRGMFSGGKGDVGQKLDAAIFQKKNDRLSASLRDALGEYKDPKEQVMGTIRHLYTNAISAKFYDQVSSMTDAAGLKMSYSFEEHGSALDTLKARIAHPPQGTTPQQIATLQKQMADLQYYVPLENSVKYGKLGGKMVNRFVRDHLASFDSPWGLMDGSIMRTLSNFHNYVKIGRTALNPITVIRNIVAAPVLMGLARANPIHALPGGAAWEAMRNPTSSLGREMLHQGIFGVDQVRSEFFRTSDQILTGDYDHHGIEGIFKSGMNKVLEFYRAPDILVRGATYVSAKAKFSEQFRLPENDGRVIDAARDWTNRYTVNYQNVAPVVKSLRQIPFSNLFISYTAEITRIAKNLVMDVFQHPDKGQRVFAAGAIGGLTAIPFLMEKASVSSLSDKDRQEWERSQAQMPDYSRSRFRVVLGKEDNRFRYLDITPLLQIDSLLQMMRTVGQTDMKGFLAVNPVFGWENTPVMNIVAEQISGKDLRTGRDIDGSVVQRMQEVLKEVVPPVLPGGYEYQRASEALATTDKGDSGITNLRTGRRTTPGELVTSYLTGMRMTTVDTAYLHRNTISDAKRQIANEASYLRDIVSTNLPDPVKQKAILRYQTSVKDILTDMQSKLEGKTP